MAERLSVLSHEEAVALVFGGHTVSECIRLCRIEPGDEVLVNGSSGSVGGAAVQVAKYFGAIVTAVTSSNNADLVRSLGADHVIDYRTEDFAADTSRFDVIFDCVGNAPFERVNGILKSGGTLLQVVADLKALLGAKADSRRSGKRVIPINFTPTPEDVEFAFGLHLKGAMSPFIDRTYSFDQIVDAHRYVDTGRKRGAVVLEIAGAVVPEQATVQRKQLAQ